MSRIAERTFEAQYSNRMITIKDIDMAVIVGMNDQTVGMTIRTMKMIEIQRKNDFVILNLRDILDFDWKFYYYHSVLMDWINISPAKVRCLSIFLSVNFLTLRI